MAVKTANAVRRARYAAESRARQCRVPATSKSGASTETPSAHADRGARPLDGDGAQGWVLRARLVR